MGTIGSGRLIIAGAASALVALWCAAPATAHDAERVSVSSDGTGANGYSDWPVASATGRYVAFVSEASNLVAGDTNRSLDIFVRDREAGTTERVSINSSEVQGNGRSGSSMPAISADGRYVAFDSDATNLVGGDGNASGDVFVRDRVAGVTHRASIGLGGFEGNAQSFAPSISADGTVVAFSSDADNLVPDDNNGHADVFFRLHLDSTGRASVDSSRPPFEGNANSIDSSLNADGRHIAFDSDASNLAPNENNGFGRDAFVHHFPTGTTERVSVNSLPDGGNADSFNPSISADGRFVAFGSHATNLVAGDANAGTDVYVRDRQAGRIERISVSSSGTEDNGDSEVPSISADGRFVAFDSDADELVADDGNNALDVFVHDRQSDTTNRISVNGGTGVEGNDHSGFPSISGDGRWIAFSSDADNLVSGDTNGVRDIFIRVREDDGGSPDPTPDPDPTPGPPSDDGGVAGAVAGSGVQIHDVISPRSLRKLFKQGFWVLASCEIDCDLVLEVRVSPGAAARMGIGGTLVARGTSFSGAGDKTWVSAKLRGAVRRSLRRHSGGGRFKLKVTAENLGG